MQHRGFQHSLNRRVIISLIFGEVNKIVFNMKKYKMIRNLVTSSLILYLCIGTSFTSNAASSGLENLSNPELGDYQEFRYTGDVQTFVAPVDGIYQLDVAGAQGGGAQGYTGGKGGYSVGYVQLEEGDTLYVVVGGQGASNIHGYGIGTGISYNGGGRGSSNHDSSYVAGGGGATHIATTNRGVLRNYNEYRNEVLIVAGGGGGAVNNGEASFASNGAPGGGLEGGTKGIGVNAAQTAWLTEMPAGTQTSAGNNGGFGYGTDGTTGVAHYFSGGGGGWYGGGSMTRSSGTGGSGYIDGCTEITYNGTTYTPVTESGKHEGDGSARITLLAFTDFIGFNDLKGSAVYYNTNKVLKVYYKDKLVYGMDDDLSAEIPEELSYIDLLADNPSVNDWNIAKSVSTNSSFTASIDSLVLNDTPVNVNYNRVSTLVTKEKYDLTAYSKLNVSAVCSGRADVYVGFYDTQDTNKPDISLKQICAQTDASGNTVNTELDISEYSGEYYIGFYYETGTSVATSLTVSELILESSEVEEPEVAEFDGVFYENGEYSDYLTGFYTYKAGNGTVVDTGSSMKISTPKATGSTANVTDVYSEGNMDLTDFDKLYITYKCNVANANCYAAFDVVTQDYLAEVGNSGTYLLEYDDFGLSNYYGVVATEPKTVVADVSDIGKCKLRFLAYNSIYSSDSVNFELISVVATKSEID